MRYHFGDDVQWADPSFDDSTRVVAQQGRWPFPALTADGFLGVRARVPVRNDAAGPLAVRLFNASDGMTDELFVNGVLVGRQGSFTLHVRYTRDCSL